MAKRSPGSSTSESLRCNLGESAEHKQARQTELQNAKLQQDIEKQNLARQNAIYGQISPFAGGLLNMGQQAQQGIAPASFQRSEEHTSELQSPCNLVCRLLLEKKKQ